MNGPNIFRIAATVVFIIAGIGFFDGLDLETHEALGLVAFGLAAWCVSPLVPR